MKPQRPWAAWILALLLLIGVGIGVLMTWHHDVQLFGGGMEGQLVGCTTSEEVNCDLVNTSEYAEVLGVPIASWGMATYGAMLVLTVLAATGKAQLLWIVFGLGLLNIGYSGFLYWVSKTQLHFVCAWCMRLYAINLLTPVLALVAGVLKAPRPAGPGVATFAAAFVAWALVSVGGERIYRNSLLGDARDVVLKKVVVDAPDNRDPEGTPRALELSVQTEDKNEAMVRVEEDDAWKGNPDAEVAVIEFADLECGYCKRAAGQLNQLYEAYGDQVLFVFKHFPMDPACNPGVKNKKHRYACRAAQGAVCAKEQGAFWAFHDLAFKNQHQLKEEHLRVYAEQAGVEMEQWGMCMKGPEAMAAVTRDGEAGKAIDVHGTPRIFIDGKLYRSGQSARQMAQAIELALGTPKEEAARKAASMKTDRTPIKMVPDAVPDMQTIEFGDLRFSVDTFEAGIDEGGAAIVGKHVVPARAMSWFAANDACEAAGKRLCTEQEWIAACQGSLPVDDDGDGQFADDLIEGNTYPYGDVHERGRCWDGRSGENDRPVYTGEMPGCTTTQGVYDLTGNVEEWVGTSPDNAVLLGGAYDTSKDHARCYRRNDTFGAGFANRRTGFRCCGK